MNVLLFSIIFIEGYVVLATELLAMRQILPVAGSGTDVISIVIAAVLLPLSFGYFAGGSYSKKSGGKTIRSKLVWNVLVAALILALGSSYFIIEVFFNYLSDIGVNNRLLQVSVYSGLFLIYPVFLLGQTIPLVSNYFPSNQLSEVTGRMLFFSTLGSFLGSVVSTIFLMSMIGVHNTAVVVIGMLCVLALSLMRRKMSDQGIYAAAILAVSVLLNSPSVMGAMHIIDNNRYSTIRFIEADNHDRHLIINNNDSSAYSDKNGLVFSYMKYIDKHFITPISNPENGDARDILVIGAGGFVLGFEDVHNNYIYVDIDETLKETSEKYILKEKIKANKEFQPVPARGFFYGNKKKFDLIVLDAYTGALSIPEHLITREYFQQVSDALKDDGNVVMNFIVCPNFADKLSMHIDNTIRTVFPYVNRTPASSEKHVYNAWSKEGGEDQKRCSLNVLYSATKTGKISNIIYTDDKNTSFLDK